MLVGQDAWLHAVVAASNAGFLMVQEARVPLCSTCVQFSNLNIEKTVAVVTICLDNETHRGPITDLCTRAALSFNGQSIDVTSVIVQCV